MDRFQAGLHPEPMSAPVLGPAVPSHDRAARPAGGSLHEPLAPFFRGEAAPSAPGAAPREAELPATAAPELETYQELPWMEPEAAAPAAEVDGSGEDFGWAAPSAAEEPFAAAATLDLEDQVVPIESLAPDEDEEDGVIPITALAPDDDAGPEVVDVASLAFDAPAAPEDPESEPAPGPEAELPALEAAAEGDQGWEAGAGAGWATLDPGDQPDPEAAVEVEPPYAAEPTYAAAPDREPTWPGAEPPAEMEEPTAEAELARAEEWGEELPGLAAEPEALSGMELAHPEPAAAEAVELPEAEPEAERLPAVAPVSGRPVAYGSPLEELAERLEQIARGLRGRSPAELFLNTDDPLEALIAGYAIGYARAERDRGAEARRRREASREEPRSD